MHFLRTELRSLDETAAAVDLEQSRADIVALSFTDSDLSVLAKAWKNLREGNSREFEGLTLRLASLGDLKHPYSVDLYVEKVAAHAKVVLIRLLGGLDYWRYGVEEIARAVRQSGAILAIVPGDQSEDPRLDQASNAPVPELRRMWRWMQGGGVENAEQCLRYAAAKLGRSSTFASPRDFSSFGRFEAARREGAAGSARALIVFYRSAWLAGDTAAFEMLADSLSARGFEVEAMFVTSLKDPEAVEGLRERLRSEPPDVILNATSFSAKLEDGGLAFDVCDAPVFQVGVSLARLDQWKASSRGLSPSDLAMNVALPEVDGRLFIGAISFKAEQSRIESLEYAPLRNEPHRANIDHAASVAAAWAALRRTEPKYKKIAFVLSDYPAKGGRAGYAVGLDTFASVHEIALRIGHEGYPVGDVPSAEDIARYLTSGSSPAISLVDYRRALAALPSEFVSSIYKSWGEPQDDPACSGDSFRFSFLKLGESVVALQPDRGRAASRKDDYHDASLSPRHAYVAFYIWLRERLDVSALIHCGAHGTLEWLPGKAVALSPECAPRAVLGSLPVIYPFIVNNPGEAAQAKRRSAALVLGHLTPPLIKAGALGEAGEIEGLMDEFAEAQTMDARRARRLAELVLERARETGLAQEAGIGDDLAPDEALTRLDAWLCDLKDMRIGDGLHVYGRPLDAERGEAMISSIADGSSLEGTDARALVERCAEAEIDGLLLALQGRHVAPGPGGAPTRGRVDVLPTGRNLYSVDPRSVPTRTAWELGSRAAQELLSRYAQDHGDWPRRIVFDLWGSATMRTGGEDLAQAMALIGVRPIWDIASNRVSGFEVLSLASLGRPRVDVTLRISGLFRDVFPSQIALFHAAVEAVAARDDEPQIENPLLEARLKQLPVARIFGAAPGAYGVGVGRAALEADWSEADDLGAAYLAATNYAYEGETVRQTTEFGDRVSSAQAFVHVQDMPGQDVLDSDAFAEHEGGFAAAAAAAGAHPSLYHFDTTDPRAPKVRPLGQEIARAVRARASNPRWLRGQMRHGFRGAAEIAETVDNLYLFAATTHLVEDRQFELLFEAVCADVQVREFLMTANPQAAEAIADRFADALRRGLWATRRNSVMDLINVMKGLS
jgi:cobaltochelatase CobN